MMRFDDDKLEELAAVADGAVSLPAAAEDALTVGAEGGWLSAGGFLDTIGSSTCGPRLTMMGRLLGSGAVLPGLATSKNFFVSSALVAMLLFLSAFTLHAVSRVDDGAELVIIEAGAADQGAVAAVDFQIAADDMLVHAAAVQDTDPLGGFGAV